MSRAAAARTPLVNVENRQRSVRFDLSWMRRFAALAVEKCLPHRGGDSFPLAELQEVEIAIVSNRVIAQVHRRFMQIAGATDVITFHHGEIVMSAQTAARCAAEHLHTVEQELALYTVHGLLHLNGFEDATPPAAAHMHLVQDRVLAACLEQIPAP